MGFLMRRLRDSKAAKVVAFILLLIAVYIFCVVGQQIFYNLQDGIYTRSQADYTRQQMFGQMREDADYITERCLYAENRKEFEQATGTDRPNSAYDLYINNQKVSGDYDGGDIQFSETFDTTDWARNLINRNETGGESEVALSDRTLSGIIAGKQIQLESVQVTIYVRSTVQTEQWDSYYHIQNSAAQRYETRYAFFIPAGITAGVALVLLVFLLWAAGHRKGEDGIILNRFDRIPIDLLFVITLIFFPITFANRYDFFSLCFFGLCLITVGTFTLMSFVARIRLSREWWKNTVIYRLVHKGEKLYDIFSVSIKSGIAKTPFLVKILVVSALVLLIEFFLLTVTYGGIWVLLFVLEKLILIPLVIVVAVWIKHITIATEKMAGGDLDYKVDAGKMGSEFKKQGENLNNIAGGMVEAVEERMRSERMKTELITNVSHDIKTPLTSIINYVDLIQKEEPENERIVEYTEVLSRQSDKLKRLITDLVEASKLSSGNVEVNLIPSDICVMAEQVAGEYQDKLMDKGLTMIASYPEIPIFIMADGRHLWRVFDNLMGNILKYSQENSRVYLAVEKLGETVQITLKNMSKYQLNITEEELMERFVRGDASRNTEGNGLGLSIARSLVQAQRGSLSVSIDGDLFKVILKFPAL